ncbi:MAG TPA: hypothetical protein VK356_13390, partial [Thermomicrobiales bacterium]|nr:hypothetical protein [Thermomicrobiales bacterium]
MDDMTTGTSIDNTAPAQLDARSHRRDGRPERLLAWVLYGFPLWWVLGLSHFIFIIMAAPMMWTLLRRRPVLAFSGFGWWLLFMAWVAASASMIYLQAPGTRRQSGLNPLVAYGYDAGWYLAITVVALYVLNSTERELPRLRVIRMLGFMFCVTVAGGIAGLLLPGLEFPSALEYVLPESFTSNGFVYNLVHLRLSLSTSFLGYEQARITAPFAYPNAWGNNFGLYLPFFIVAWMGKDAGWRRAIAPFILLAAVAPVVLALNRGLWLGLLLVGAYWLIRLLLQRNVRAIAVSSTIAVLGVMILVLSPLGQT